MSESTSNADHATPPKPRDYVVVARRYRPQAFDELVGQQHVAKALSNAISTNRVGHAYLFTGARGVGKTSAARIFAKALDCVDGPTPTPCGKCDICQSISSGDDVDVLEIDGASNRGIDEIRQLRQNASVRPSRARLKIYIIDEVHMLTREAFNALLKTLEEPPKHVKFVFCTTEPTKIPITILSRCQRFDFAGIITSSIAERLTQIAKAEGISAEPDAVEVLARRAAGSMRDGQSLLEQLLAFAPEKITVAEVHGMLGSAGEERLAQLVSHLVDRNSAATLADFDSTIQEGVDIAQLLEQLFGYFRDCMAAVVGCPPEMFLYASPSAKEQVVEAGKRLGLHTTMAAMQIIDQTLSRLRFSTQGRILAELALVRICALDDLDELPALIARLHGGPSGSGTPRSSSSAPARGGSPRPGASRSGPKTARSASSGSGGEVSGVTKPQDSKPDVPSPEVDTSGIRADLGPSDPADQSGNTPPPPVEKIGLTAENAAEIWSRALSRVSGLGAKHAEDYSDIATSAPNRLVVRFKPAYNLAKSICERPEQAAKFEKALAEVTGQRVKVEFSLLEAEVAQGETEPSTRTISPQQRINEIVRHPMIRRAGELFGATPIGVDETHTKK